MAANFEPSAACCSTPAVIGPEYKHKGKFVDVDGYKTYIAGPSDATKALFIIYDVFGFSSQILEGADKLAETYRVFMPGFFGEDPAPLDWMPLDGPENEEKLDAFCEGPGNTDTTLERIAVLKRKFQETQPCIDRWGLVGYCWGGYVASYALGSESAFSACVELHPGFPKIAIAERVSVPLLALCSKDEPESMYREFKGALKVEHHMEDFPNMVHGWMSARADLAKIDVRKDFDRGYDMVAEWFGRYL